MSTPQMQMPLRKSVLELVILENNFAINHYHKSNKIIKNKHHKKLIFGIIIFKNTKSTNDLGIK